MPSIVTASMPSIVTASTSYASSFPVPSSFPVQDSLDASTVAVQRDGTNDSIVSYTKSDPRSWTVAETAQWVALLFDADVGKTYAAAFRKLSIDGRLLLDDADDEALRVDIPGMPVLHRRRIQRERARLRGSGADLEASSDGLDSMAKAMELAQELMLQFQTCPKYRVLNTLYFAFRTADSVLLVTILVLTLIDHRDSHAWHLVVPSYKEYMVFGAAGLELFHDIMKLTSKFWFLERLSVYFGICLYALYFFICYHALGDDMFKADSYVVWVLVIRLLAFVFEECLDIAIDCEMHNDWVLVCGHWSAKDTFPYTDVRRSIDVSPAKLAEDFYIGSKSAWLPWSAFDLDSYKRDPIPAWRFRWLYFLPALLLLVPAACVGSMLAFCVLALFLVGRCFSESARAHWLKEMNTTY
jgi:hypothetical protein